MKHFHRLTPIARAFRRGVSPAGQSCPHDTDNDGCEREYGDANTSCGQYNDAMVCTGQYGGNEITCSAYDGQTYRGCYYGQQDVDSGTDYCCAGSTGGYMPNDSIDHASCQSGYDAAWGSSCVSYDDPGDSCPWWDDVNS